MPAIDFTGLIQTHVIPWSINITFALAIFFIGKYVANILVNITGKILRKTGVDSILVNFIESLLKAVLLLFIIIAVLDRLGVNTTSLIAVMGAAGLAVGLALQSSLQNFAAGVMLLIFKPFKAGDFIQAGGIEGKVESINIFTSTLKTGDNREIIVPNGSIYSTTITNFSAKDTRRIDLIFGIGYNDDIRHAKTIIESVIKAEERILQDQECTIAVAELAESSVNLVVRPWVKSSDYWVVRFDLIENIKLAFDKNGISIPYPQMDVHIDK
jgi:small conductance mechanosensitive channel